MIVFALLVSFFALQNTTGATITLANYTFRNIPLYFIVIGSILAGIAMSLVINIFQTLSSSLTLRRKNTTIKGAHNTIADLQSKIHDLEIENAKLVANILLRMKHLMNRLFMTQQNTTDHHFFNDYDIVFNSLLDKNLLRTLTSLIQKCS
jgi:uncharacterized integral membrane protein